MAHFFYKNARLWTYGKEFNRKGTWQGYWAKKRWLILCKMCYPSWKAARKVFLIIGGCTKLANGAKYIRLHAPQIAESNSKKRTNNITVNEWFEIWDETMLVGKADNTRRNYRERYEKNAKEILGDLRLTDVKPLHCKAVLNGMIGDYANSTMRQTYVTLGVLFKSAKENGLIEKTSVGWCPC